MKVATYWARYMMIYNHCEEASLADYGGLDSIAPFEFDDITHECDEIAG